MSQFTLQHRVSVLPADVRALLPCVPFVALSRTPLCSGTRGRGNSSMLVASCLQVTKPPLDCMCCQRLSQWRAQQQDPSTCFQLSHQMSWQRVPEGMSAPAPFALSGEAKLLESGCCSRLRQTPPDPGCSMPQQRNQTSLLHIPEGVSAPAQCPLSPGRWLQSRQPQLQNPVQQQPPSRIAAQPVPGVLDCQAAARTLTAAGVPLDMRYCMSSSHDEPKHRRP